MQDTGFDSISHDTTILAIGTMFRRIDSTQWAINLELTPKTGVGSLRVSNLPVLARKRVLNSTQDHEPAGFLLSFVIDSTETWQRQILGNYPVSTAVHAMDKRQHCFCFFVNDIQIYLPQLELARALFMHNGYLSRSALEPNYLKSEFSIVYGKPNVVRVNVLPSSSYPIKSLGEYESRRLLSWILLDPDARASYESIGRSQKLHGYEKGGYRHWNFEFTPPLLSSVYFEVRGRFDQHTKSLFVYEVTSLRNIRASIPDEVEFFHPKFREYVRAEGEDGIRLIAERPLLHSVHDCVDANADTLPILLRAPAVAFEFSKAFNTSKVVEGKQEGIRGKSNNQLGPQASTNVSTEESVVGGELPSAEWTAELDETDDLNLYANKFDCFQLMLDELVAVHGCVIRSKQLRKLPKLYRCNRHLLLDGNPRCLAVIEIESQNRIFHILEVDTSDGICSLSTMLLRLKSLQGWQEQLRLVEKELTQKSLHWPSKRLREACGKDGYFGIPHPQTKSVDKGKLHEESIEHWVARFYSWMILNQ